MSLISVFLAWLQTQDQGVDVFLDRLVEIELWFYLASWWLWGAVLCLVIGIGIAWLIACTTGNIGHGALFGFGGLFGCFIAGAAVILLILPLTSWITLQFATGMANTYGPAGIVSDAFWLHFVLFVLFILTGG